MGKGLQGYQTKESVCPAVNAVDGVDNADVPQTRAIHCNVAGTYKMDFGYSSASVDMVLLAGVTYPFSIINIRTDEVMDVGDITLLY